MTLMSVSCRQFLRKHFRRLLFVVIVTYFVAEKPKIRKALTATAQRQR